jgi:hypothetical protein
MNPEEGPYCIAPANVSRATTSDSPIFIGFCMTLTDHRARSHSTRAAIILTVSKRERSNTEAPMVREQMINFLRAAVIFLLITNGSTITPQCVRCISQLVWRMGVRADRSVAASRVRRPTGRLALTLMIKPTFRHQSAAARRETSAHRSATPISTLAIACPSHRSFSP